MVEIHKSNSPPTATIEGNLKCHVLNKAHHQIEPMSENNVHMKNTWYKKLILNKSPIIFGAYKYIEVDGPMLSALPDIIGTLVLRQCVGSERRENNWELPSIS